jgi:hypothetical protein
MGLLTLTASLKCSISLSRITTRGGCAEPSEGIVVASSRTKIPPVFGSFLKRFLNFFGPMRWRPSIRTSELASVSKSE